jgi:hypothetical protein
VISHHIHHIHNPKSIPKIHVKKSNIFFSLNIYKITILKIGCISSTNQPNQAGRQSKERYIFLENNELCDGVFS